MLLFSLLLPSSALLPTRRALTLAAPAALFSSALPGLPTTAALAADPYTELRARLDGPIVTQSGDMAPVQGRVAPTLPGWLAGRWKCTQTLTAYSTPQGVQFIGAAGRPISEAEASAAQTRAQIGKPVTLELRWNAAGDGAAIEDRAFNARSRLDAFAGRPVVRSSQTCDAAGVNAPGLSCTFIEFTGPILQKQISNSLRVATLPGAAAAAGKAGSSYVSSEATRQIFARRKVAGDTRDFPPITTDSEVLISLAPALDGAGASGKLRLVEYLNANDPLYFAAARKSVSISDYSITLVRLQE